MGRIFVERALSVNFAVFLLINSRNFILEVFYYCLC